MRSGGATPGPEAVSLAGEWTIQRGDERFVAADFGMLQQWQRAGRLRDTDLIWHPSLSEWKRVTDVSGLFATARPPDAVQSASKGRGWALLPLAGCAGLIVLVGLILLAGSVGPVIKRATTGGPPKLVVTEGSLDDNESAWNETLQVVNVSDEPLSDVTLKVVWTHNGKILSEGFGKLRQPLQPGEMTTITAFGKFEKGLPLLREPSYQEFLPKSDVDKAFMSSYEQEQVTYRFMKAREAVQQANAATLRQIYDSGIDWQFVNSTGDQIPHKSSAAGEALTDSETKIVQAAFAAFEPAKEEEATRQRQEEAARAERERQKQHEDAVAMAIQGLRSSAEPMISDSLGIIRSWKNRYPDQEAYFRRNIEAALDRQTLVIRAQFSWSEEQAKTVLQPVKEEVLQRWDREVTQSAIDKH